MTSVLDECWMTCSFTLRDDEIHTNFTLDGGVLPNGWPRMHDVTKGHLKIAKGPSHDDYVRNL